jgi:hypothetical protein
MEKRPEVIQKTELRAMGYLQDVTTIPSAPPLGNYSLLFRVWHYPPFAACCSWSVLKSRMPYRPSEYLVRQMTWDRPHDCLRLRDPLFGLQEGFHSLPKMEVRDRAVDGAELSSRLEAGRLISLAPIGRHRGICLDGAIFGFEAEFGSPRLEWCCDGPPDWCQFIAWADEMRKWLQELCIA